jgi:hypothetical protein
MADLHQLRDKPKQVEVALAAYLEKPTMMTLQEKCFFVSFINRKGTGSTGCS